MRAPCLHCRTPFEGEAGERFCCAGCEAVHGLLVEQGLTRYYTLAGAELAAAPDPERRSHAWLEPLLATAMAGPGALKSLELDVQGIHCAACVWLFNETFRRRGGSAILVNPALGRVRLQWDPARLEPSTWIIETEKFGYAFGPASKQPRAAGNGLPLRLGICAALTLNVMLFSLSFYFGLAREEGELFVIFSRLSVALSTAVVLIGGWPFFRGALRGLQSRVLHLDLPIALGIVLVWSTCLVRASTTGDAAYFDTLNVFITLMLLGRWLQQRVLERNRRFLLEDDGAQGIFVRRRSGAQIEVVPAPKIRAGDVMVIAPGDLVPVDARVSGPVRVSTDWITGESSPRELAADALAPAGSFNAGRTAFTAVAATGFAESSLVALLRQPPSREGQSAKHLQFWNRLARRWVAQVLLAAGLGFVLWLPAGAARALEVATALLVVTCPCAIGIALPLAYELTQARLRRRGFFVRSTDLLDRLTRVRTVVFDKTGTLTLGRLALEEPMAIDRLSEREANVLFNLCCRSSHPVSVALMAALGRRATAFDPTAEVVEVPGGGVEWKSDDGTWRVGRADWAATQARNQTGVMLTHDGEICAAFGFREALRAGAAEQVEALRARGLSLWLLSGDAPHRVAALAARLGFLAGHAHGALSPEDKAAYVRRLGDAVLYLGDGVNDAPAFAAALCAGTPAIERPVMPSRSDFFLVGVGLDPIRDALEAAAKLRRVVRRVLALSLGYNVVAVAIAFAGWMSPVKAAIFMPVSSLSVLLITGLSLRERTPAAAPVRLASREARA